MTGPSPGSSIPGRTASGGPRHWRRGGGCVIGALRHTGFRAVWVGQLLSQFGNAAFSVVGLWQLRLHSPLLLSVAGLASMLPTLLSTVGGTVVDHVDPRRLMLTTDLLRGVGLGLALFGLVASPALAPALIIAVLAINALGGAFFGPAESVAIPYLVPDGDLPSANGLMSTTWQLSGAVGSALGGAALAGLGLRLIFGFDLLSFWFSAAAILFVIRLGTGAPRFAARQARQAVHRRENPQPFWRSLYSGFGALREIGWLVTLLPLILLANFGGNGAGIMLPFWVRHVLHANVAWFGLIEASWAGGMLVGSILTGVVATASIRRVVGAMALIQGVLITGFILAPTPLVAAGCLLVAGAANGVVNALITTLFQRLIPEDVQGRAFGLMGTLMSAANPLAAIVAGLTLRVLPLWWMWALLALSSLGLGWGLWARLPDRLPAAPVSTAVVEPPAP